MMPKHVASISSCISIYQKVHFLVSRMNSCIEYDKFWQGLHRISARSKTDQGFQFHHKNKNNKLHSKEKSPMVHYQYATCFGPSELLSRISDAITRVEASLQLKVWKFLRQKSVFWWFWSLRFKKAIQGHKQCCKDFTCFLQNLQVKFLDHTSNVSSPVPSKTSSISHLTTTVRVTDNTSKQTTNMRREGAVA